MTECQHLDTWFDRTLCACGGQDGYPGMMHTICVDCGTILGPDGIRHQRYLDSIPDTLLMDTPEDMARLAQIIRTVDGGHSLGAGALAEAVVIELRVPHE
jgi:hypothetical protein